MGLFNPAMKLYLVERTNITGLDEFDAMVVAERTPGEAMLHHPGEHRYDWVPSRENFENTDTWVPWFSDAPGPCVEFLKATEIGRSRFNVAGVVLTSFNAG